MNDNLVKALTAASALLTLIGQSTIAVTAINVMITKARSEGRDITDAELASVLAESHAMTDKLVSDLKAQLAAQ
jgi:hypothetical protein